MSCRGQRPPPAQEKIGARLPSDLFFLDETGKVITVDKVIKGPTILSLVSYRCGSACPLILGNLSDSLLALGSRGGAQCRVTTISFDEEDTPEVAREQKRNYLASAGNLPESSWSFLTADRENIEKLTRSIGFRYRREGRGFSHSREVIIISGDKRIVRYLPGARFSSFDLKMALTEAAAERTLAAGILLFSYRFDPDEGRYVFNFAQVFFTALFGSAVIIAISMAASRLFHRFERQL